MSKPKALLISPYFFDYHVLIKTELENKGYETKLLSDRLFNNNFFKSLVRINKFITSKISSPFYKNIFNSLREFNPQIILVINGEGIAPNALSFLKNLFPSAKLIFYTWDSAANKKSIRDSKEIFDTAWSFDRADCNKFGFRFLPLFFKDSKNNQKLQKYEQKYKLSFIGTVHSNRMEHINYFSRLLSNEDFYKYLYLQSRIIFYINKSINKDFIGSHIGDFHFSPIPYNQFTTITNLSKAVLDINHPHQSGLTMRTIEVIGLKKKLITTNKDIINYDFYEPSNILILDENKSKKAIFDFLDSDYSIVDPDILKKYTLSNWLNIIINE